MRKVMMNCKSSYPSLCIIAGPRFESHHGKSFGKVLVGKKKKKKKKGQLSSACMMEVRMMGVLPNS